MTAARVGRIRDRESFVVLRRAGRRGRSDGVTATWTPSADGSICLALAVGRAAGGAVVRNRLRRQLREIFRSLAAEGGAAPLEAGTYLLAAGRSAVGLPHQALRSRVGAALDEAGAR